MKQLRVTVLALFFVLGLFASGEAVNQQYIQAIINCIERHTCNNVRFEKNDDPLYLGDGIVFVCKSKRYIIYHIPAVESCNTNGCHQMPDRLYMQIRPHPEPNDEPYQEFTDLGLDGSVDAGSILNLQGTLEERKVFHVTYGPHGFQEHWNAVYNAALSETAECILKRPPS